MGYLDKNQKGILHKAVLPFTMAGYNVLAIDLRNHGTIYFILIIINIQKQLKTIND